MAPVSVVIRFASDRLYHTERSMDGDLVFPSVWFSQVRQRVRVKVVCCVNRRCYKRLTAFQLGESRSEAMRR